MQFESPQSESDYTHSQHHTLNSNMESSLGVMSNKNQKKGEQPKIKIEDSINESIQIDESLSQSIP